MYVRRTDAELCCCSMPPAAKAVLVKVTPDVLELQEVISFVQDHSAGAIATFSGVTRNYFDGKKVIKLEYEAYDAMAEKVLQVCGSTDQARCAHYNVMCVPMELLPSPVRSSCLPGGVLACLPCARLIMLIKRVAGTV